MLEYLMKNLIITTTFLMVMLGFYQSAEAQYCYEENGQYYNLDGTPCTNAVLTAVPFLRIVADARSGAMGDVGLAISPDANSMHFNASKLAFIEDKAGLSATYTPWLRSLGLNDVYLAYLSGFVKTGDLQAIGYSLRYFSLGSIQFTDANGMALNTGKPNEFEVALAYSRKLTDDFSAALTGKFIYSNLASGQQTEGGDVIEPALAGAADLSVYYQNEMKSGDNLNFGMAITNIGSKVTYTRSLLKDFIPTNLGIGAAYEWQIDDYNTLTIATDINKLLVPTPCQGEDCDTDGNGPDYKEIGSIRGIFTSFGDAPEGFSEELKELMYSFGVEYWYDKQFAVRAGYFAEHAQKGNRKYFTVGLGLKYNIFGMNISYLVPTTTQRNPLDNTLRFSLLFDFSAFDADGE